VRKELWFLSKIMAVINSFSSAEGAFPSLALALFVVGLALVSILCVCFELFPLNDTLTLCLWEQRQSFIP
jgi:hypothetical protein